MNVFVTGATGFVGTAVVKELISAGHQVTGLARSEASANALIVAGAQVHRGDLEDLESLRAGAMNAEGVIHAGFVHDFTRFKEVCEIDRVAIETIGSVLAGSNRPLVVTSGTALVRPGVLATEDMASHSDPEKFPRMSEAAALACKDKGVRVSMLRLAPSVHGEGDRYGFIPMMINIAREKRISAYIHDGANRWNAVHRLDAAKLYRLALEHGETGSYYHAVGDEAITVKIVAEKIAGKLNIPSGSVTSSEAPGHFAWFSNFAALDCPASSAITQKTMNWRPTHPGLLEDLSGDVYFK
jgi:nucleoside-diphosphate-sugar epimerase